jgi:hypothetical protein
MDTDKIYFGIRVTERLSLTLILSRWEREQR